MKLVSSLVTISALLAACGGSGHQRSEALPELPTMRAESFQPTIRAAVQQLWEAAEDDPENPAANGALAKILHAHQQNATAEICYRRARILEPERFEWTYLLAAVQAEQGKDDLALGNLERAIEIDPDYAPAQVVLADLLLKNSKLARAEEHYTAALERDRNSAIAWYGLGRVQSAGGRSKASVESFENAVTFYPNYGQAHYALAQGYRRLKRTDEAKRHFQLGEEHKLESPPTGDRVLTEVRRLTRSPTDFLRAAVEMDKQGKLEESLALHLEVLKIDPDQEQAHINLISIYGRLGQIDKAREHYRKAMELNENLPDCHYNYGVLMASLEKPEEGRKAFERAVEINPFYAKAHHNLGMMLESEGKLGEASEQYRTAIENQPDYRLAHFHLGRILVNQGDYNGAIRHFRQILTPEDQDTPGYEFALGIAYARNGDRARALEHARKAKEQASTHNQWQLLASINKALAALEGRPAAR